MTIQTGAAGDVFTLLGDLADFASSTLGWTVNEETSDELYLQNGGDHWSLKAVNDVYSNNEGWSLFFGSSASWQHEGILLMGNRGYSAAAAWNAQPGASGATSVFGVFPQSVVREYYFLSNAAADYIHVLARRSANVWTIILLGALAKFGTWTGGAYQAGLPQNSDPDPTDGQHGLFQDTNSVSLGTAINADIDGANDAWQRINGTIAPRYLYSNEYGGGLEGIRAADWSGRAPLWPPLTFLNRGGGNYSYGGYPKDVRHLLDPNMSNGREITIGSDTWLHVNQYAFRLIS